MSIWWQAIYIIYWFPRRSNAECHKERVPAQHHLQRRRSRTNQNWIFNQLICALYRSVIKVFRFCPFIVYSLLGSKAWWNYHPYVRKLRLFIVIWPCTDNTIQWITFATSRVYAGLDYRAINCLVIVMWPTRDQLKLDHWANGYLVSAVQGRDPISCWWGVQ